MTRPSPHRLPQQITEPTANPAARANARLNLGHLGLLLSFVAPVMLLVLVLAQPG